MGLRAQVLLMFLIVNGLGVLGLAYLIQRDRERTQDLLNSGREYAMIQEARARGQLDPALRARLEHWIEGVESYLNESLERQTLSFSNWLKVAEGLRTLDIWSDPQLRSEVTQAVVIHRPVDGASARYFNPPRDLIGDLDPEKRKDISELVGRSRAVVAPVMRGNHVGGALQVDAEHWGGVWFSLKPTPNPLDLARDEGWSLERLSVFLVPIMALLLLGMWYLLSHRVVRPLEQLEDVATAVSQGDYSRRLEDAREDEVGHVMASFNRMMSLVEGYRDELEDRVVEKTKEIEQKTRELMLGQRLAATGQLAAGIAHEINNPLAGMINVVKRLERSDLKPEQRAAYLEILEEGMERIGSIVQQLLAVSPRKVTPSLVDVHKELERVVALTDHKAGQKGVTIVTDLAEEAPPILGECNEIGQIFLNLVINAIDASHEGGRVDIRTTSASDRLVCTIEDYGVGMPPEVAERAFDMFFTTKEVGEGTGIGLATVHHLVEAHGGTLELRSAVGEGTQVTVRFPTDADRASRERPSAQTSNP